jgi:hypothetical protein
MQFVQKKRANASEASLPASNRYAAGAARNEGHSLFQDLFFFCTVKGIGDLPAGGPIYVEVVVDRDSGAAFAKVYPAFNPLNAVDILASRVLPYFKQQGLTIGEIFTPGKHSYSGLIAAHPYESFLSSAHVRHVELTHRHHPHYYLCEQFYWFLLKEFFQPALRRTFQVSLEQLQTELDAFLATYNSTRSGLRMRLNAPPDPSANFPFGP